MASYLLPHLQSKQDVDNVIRHTEELVLVLRFGKDEDPVCLQLDHILAKSVDDLGKMAKIYTVDVDKVPVTADHTKFIGTFQSKQDLIDVVEVIFRGAMKGKVMVRSPLDPTTLQKYDLVYKDF
ncbi:TXN4B-like protein [Mya arenaria]|uniref:TXN4B-like protein n=1 Tax=Mya arenaria TaxID=6604 RepID=A0ABY7FVG4_MYAAR|nr:TXN4B-like protein [Mya arenaria]